MTERRTTITRTWRPITPAPRVDDFQEAPAEPVRMPEHRRQPEHQVERRNIGRRLENWGMWANMDKRSSASSDDCMTQVVCENMLRNSKDALKLLPPTVAECRIDVPDAELINLAFTELPEMHREVLNWTYVVCAKPWGVAGACGFPTREYDDRLRSAQEAIEAIVGGQQNS